MKFIKFTIIIIALVINTVAYSQSIKLSGNIENFCNKSLRLYQCNLDTLYFIDSARTDNFGNFKFQVNHLALLKNGLCKVSLNEAQYFYIINSGENIKIKSKFESIPQNTVLLNLKVVESYENQMFYKFQSLQDKINVAREILFQMLRYYPISDSFHKKIEEEYYLRFKNFDDFIKTLRVNKNGFNGTLKIANAYFYPVMPSYKLTDEEKVNLIKIHFFDFFNPADSFYINTNILPEKIDEWIGLHVPLDEKIPINEQQLFLAAESFIKKTESNSVIFKFTLSYILKKFNKNRLYKALLSTYDRFLIIEKEDCNQDNDDFSWMRNLASTLRNIELGKNAPNFKINEYLSLNDLPGDYTLVIFWASWCSHCVATIPELRDKVNAYKMKNTSQKIINVISVSLDKDKIIWQNYINQNGLSSWLNICDLKSWQSDIAKMYNVYATPTMFLLDKDKKIIAIPMTNNELFEYLK